MIAGDIWFTVGTGRA